MLSKLIEANVHPAKRVRAVVSREKVVEDVVGAVTVGIAETVQIALKVNVLGVMTQATAQAAWPIMQLVMWLAVQQRAAWATTP